MKEADLMRRGSAVLARVALCVAVLTPVVSASPAQSSAPAANSETYEWPAEFVSLNEASRMLTAKGMVTGNDAPTALQGFQAGDDIVLHWSGVTSYADAVNRAVRADAPDATSGRFAFPVKFVSYDAERRYVTFEVQVPQEAIAELKNLQPGQWLTATSRRNSNTAIVSVRPWGSPATPPASSN